MAQVTWSKSRDLPHIKTVNNGLYKIIRKTEHVIYEQANLLNHNRPSTRLRNDEKNQHHPLLNQELLSALTQGYWKPKYVTEEENDRVTSQLKRLRERKKIEYSNNTICGHAHRGYRSVCNPGDKNACCKESRCRDISVEGCVCPTCFDERSRIYPEFHEWTPYGINIRRNVSRDVMCTGLRNLNVSSIITIGDSLIRQITVRFWRRVYKGPVIHLLHDYSPQELIQKCQPNATNWGSYKCWERSFVNICDGIKFFYHKIYGVTYQPKVFDDLRTLKKEHPGRMLVLTDVGLHDNFSILNVSIYLKQLFEVVKSLGETDLLYMAPYIPGLQKSPSYKKQTLKRTIKFIKFFRTFTQDRNISFLDPTELVKNLISSDGTHYTRGLNEAMVDIIGNYILKDI
ncbi:unnamed protein product [Owenia fusiformis]|uniref:Uncharacterized protein n=1 Tax=Owenia fusiformis TaxID=6347 RepID=A0A8S4Q6K1_OWEFU|nr:unnamed protein product [Owenia fusiformis]